jgi:HemY protein
MLLFSVLRGLWRTPARAADALRRRREARGQHAIMRGLIAVGSGDARSARQHAEDAKKIAPHEPLALLLAAQSAQLAGDRAGADQAFRAMAEHPHTRLLGLRGLFIEAQRDNDIQKAVQYAEEAARIAPALPWAGQAVLQLRCAAGDWEGALEVLERNRAAGSLDRQSHKRHRAVLLTARALELEDKDRDTSQALVHEAVKLAPDLVPAVALSARYHAEAGNLRKASRMLERAWQVTPHPDLAEAHAYLRFGDSARDRLARVQKLASLSPDHKESALALARAAIDAREFQVARRALRPYLAQPSQRVALLMADLERAEASDEGRSREWTARAVYASRDPVWTADGFVSDRWLPFSPVTGRLDAFEWKAPTGELGHRQADADTDARAQETPSRPMIEVAPVPEPEPATPAPRAAAETRPLPPRTFDKAGTARAPIADSVVPITHVPDDPGPDVYQEPEPLPEQTSAAAGWKRLFQ